MLDRSQVNTAQMKPTRAQIAAMVFILIGSKDEGLKEAMLRTLGPEVIVDVRFPKMRNRINFAIAGWL